jgi:type I restriction enzyme M protein
MVETTFRNLNDTLRKDAGCSSELDYIEQTSWLLFLKYLDDFEADRAAAAVLSLFRSDSEFDPIVERGQ